MIYSNKKAHPRFFLTIIIILTIIVIIILIKIIITRSYKAHFTQTCALRFRIIVIVIVH